MIPFLVLKEGDATSRSDMISCKRARKSDLRRKCVKLTKQLLDSLNSIEDYHSLEEVSQVLSTLLKDLAHLNSKMEGKPLHSQAKNSRALSQVPALLSQGDPKGPESAHSDCLGAQAASDQELTI